MSGDMHVQELMVARQLMARMEALRQKHKAKGQTPLGKNKLSAEYEALLSGEAQAAHAKNSRATHDDDVQIHLGQLRQKLKAAQGAPAEPTGQTVRTAEIYFEERTRTEMSVSFKTLKAVDGLVLNDQQQAETDRYQFDFLSGTTFKITDKWTGKSSTVWSDPMVDLSDVEGNVNGDFKDLQASLTHTTFQLQDGTRVTFTAQDSGVIEEVDIFKGDQHLRGVGAGSGAWAQTQFFAGAVKTDGRAAAGLLAKGDVVVAGGDGNDWFNEYGARVWGQTTGPIVSSRPAYVLEMNITHVTEQVARVRMVDTQI